MKLIIPVSTCARNDLFVMCSCFFHQLQFMHIIIMTYHEKKIFLNSICDERLIVMGNVTGFFYQLQFMHIYIHI